MVNAELDDLKTMTRRSAVTERFYRPDAKIPAGARAVEGGFVVDRPSFWTKVKPGDRLWVREDWRVSNRWDAVPPSKLVPRKMSVVFDAGGSIANQKTGTWAPDRSYPPAGERPSWLGRRRASMHLPRWASRITLLVTSTKIEPVQEISETDAIAEGMVYVDHGFRADGQLAEGWHHNPDQAALGSNFCFPSARAAFANLWCTLHGKQSWDDNPDVVAISFRVIKANIDALEARAA